MAVSKMPFRSGNSEGKKTKSSFFFKNQCFGGCRQFSKLLVSSFWLHKASPFNLCHPRMHHDLVWSALGLHVVLLSRHQPLCQCIHSQVAPNVLAQVQVWIAQYYYFPCWQKFK